MLEVTIEDIGVQGDGIARHEGTTLFVAGTLPGERIQVRREGPRAELLEILSPSPDRVPPPCPHFLRCGGCRLQHMSDTSYAAWKVAQLRQLLEREGLGDVPLRPLIVTPPATRRRARLAVHHGREGMRLGFNAWRSQEIVNVTACPVLLPELESFLHALREPLGRWLPKGESCDLQLTALPGGMDVVLIGGPALGLAERETLARLAEELNIAKLSWRKWDRSPVEPIAHRLSLSMRYGDTSVPFPPGSFLQATEQGEAALIAFTRAAVGEGARLLDLFAGLGAFGLSMTKASEVHFADLDGPAITALGQAARRAPRYHVEQRNLIREPYTATECNRFDVVLFDPPRGGAKTQAEHLAHSSISTIIAISCDPASFARDARILQEGGYKLTELQPVDQFLWSTHLELAGVFVR